jgi:molybdopterin molybdotransferase
MRGFAERATVEAALDWLGGQIAPLPGESIPLDEASGRVLAADVVSSVNVPSFTRGMMDGYAVRADDTQGASPYNPLSLRIIGQCLPGNAFSGTLETGQTVRMMTGAPLPTGADAVLPVEQTEVGEAADTVRVQGEVSPGKHVGTPGEDIAAQRIVLEQGRVLRPQDVGVLASIGVACVDVVRRPRVRILVTGDELLPAGSAPTGYRIADANGPMLSALAARDGGAPRYPEIVPDQPDAILEALFDDVDIVLVSGGSSVGQEDHLPTLLAEHGELAIHGIAMRPSSPAGMGRLGDRLVFLLPGNPVSCLCAYDFFAGRAVRGLAGRNVDWPYRRVKDRLARKLVSMVGRVDYARVKQTDSGIEPLAISGASMLSSTTRADGFVVIPADSEGYAGGSEVDVYLYD